MGDSQGKPVHHCAFFRSAIICMIAALAPFPFHVQVSCQISGALGASTAMISLLGVLVSLKSEVPNTKAGLIAGFVVILVLAPMFIH